MNIPSEANEHYLKPMHTHTHTRLFCVPYAVCQERDQRENHRGLSRMAVVTKNDCSKNEK